jgi:predicted 3-demethylubiquinone-9 3-methyltransferase (glyoxalase superfamily)
MQKITPFLWFEKDCEEAINFYVSVFNSAPNKKAESKVLEIQRYPEGIKDAPWTKEMTGKVLTAVFELGGQQLMALDGGPGVFGKSGVVSLLIDCKTQEEIDHFWSKLGEGGDEKAQQCGWLSDKYGFVWQVVPNMDKWLKGSDSEGSKRAMQAMLKMKKIVITDLEKAYNG